MYIEKSCIHRISVLLGSQKIQLRVFELWWLPCLIHFRAQVVLVPQGVSTLLRNFSVLDQLTEVQVLGALVQFEGDLFLVNSPLPRVEVRNAAVGLVGAFMVHLVAL